ncbi:MAG TPA: response regulator [Candidatus Saccharibacteria bacterium]|nr:response regulator [Candidatus Saccharibacteria bacterium]HRK93759.1 response regulator [Candidatus Saccharibacteria bacterium]
MHKILIVEDEDILREAYYATLSSQGYQCDVAENGKVALEKCQTTTYDLILLDLMMPVMSGVKFLEKFMPNVPDGTEVVVLSNLSSGVELEQAMDLGVYRCLLKSDVSPKELVAAVRNELGDEG